MTFQDSGPALTSRMETSELDESVATVQFLRRLASFISVGENAAKLDYAAVLIESLVGRLDDTRRALQEQTDKAAALMDMCVTYETLIDRQHLDITNVNAAREQQEAEFAGERTELKNEVERLSALTERLDAGRAAAVAEADMLKTKLEVPTDAATVPVTTLLAIRTQFEALSDEFLKKGDLISQVMSHVGRCTIDQAIVEAEPQVSDPLGSGLKTKNAAAWAA